MVLRWAHNILLFHGGGWVLPLLLWAEYLLSFSLMVVACAPHILLFNGDVWVVPLHLFDGGGVSTSYPSLQW